MSLSAECVAAGAAVLDKSCPGWELRIRLADLEMASHKDCVLGQLYGDVVDGLERLGLEREELYDLGFDWFVGTSYDSLKTAWIELIRGRRQAEHNRPAIMN
jgi:hypothetical protein